VRAPNLTAMPIAIGSILTFVQRSSIMIRKPSVDMDMNRRRLG